MSCRVINKLHEENEEARKTLIEHEKTQKQLEEFKKSNKDLLSEMETMKSLHQKVGSTEEREEDVSVKVVEQCKRQSLKFCASYRRIFNKKSTIKLEVSQHFKLSEVMAKLYKANTFSFLFKSCPREVHKILQKLEIIFKGMFF